ncbi:MAG TPA: thiamine pyrophosphate-dependent enzyme [Chloroflexota bacterium]|nr:thiamine pyrophosphate-dependent enzyme [Chloroflexota bacterium]
MSRVDALKLIAEAYPRDPIVVTLGATARELAAVARSDNHLYVLDSMGLPPAIGLGLSLGLEASSFDKCLVVEGDGSLLMGLSTLATIGLLQPAKLFLIVLDNGVYAATGGQETASKAIDFAAVARGCGITARDVDSSDDFARELDRCRTDLGPILLRVRIGAVNAKTPYLLEDPVLLGDTFRSYVTANRG